MAPDARSCSRFRWQRLSLLLALATASAALPVVAQVPQPGIIYSCVANGRTYSGDRPPPECSNSDIRELNRDGSVRRVVPRPLTVEEQRARALEAKKKLEEEEKQVAQRRRDRSLLEAYASEEEIEAARKKSVDGAEQIVKRSMERTESLGKDRKRLDEEKEFYKKREMPDSLARALTANAQAVGAESKIIAEAKEEIQRINERFEAEKKRLRELISQGARPVQRNPETDILMDPRFKGK